MGSEQADERGGVAVNGDVSNKLEGFELRAGQWLYSTCGCRYYAEILAIGPVEREMDIRIQDPDELVDFDQEWHKNDPPLSHIELPEGTKIILRRVQWKYNGWVEKTRDPKRQIVDCNTPNQDGCYRCTKSFEVHEAEETEGAEL